MKNHFFQLFSNVKRPNVKRIEQFNKILVIFIYGKTFNSSGQDEIWKKIQKKDIYKKAIIVMHMQ